MIVILNRREKMFLLVLLMVFGAVLFYFYMYELRDNFQDIRSDKAWCEDKLEQTRYQLVAVTEYKDRIDKLLTETKMAYDNDKERFQEIMDNFIEMKKQYLLCQAQFEDLQQECSAAKEKLVNVLNTLEAGKIGEIR